MLEYHCLGVADVDRFRGSDSKLSRWKVRSSSTEFDLVAAARCDVFIVSDAWPGCWDVLLEVKKRYPHVIRVLMTSGSSELRFCEQMQLFHRLIDGQGRGSFQALASDVLRARALVSDTSLRRCLLSLDSLPRSEADDDQRSQHPESQAIDQLFGDTATTAALLKCTAPHGPSWLNELISAEADAGNELAAMLDGLPLRKSLSGFSVTAFHRRARRVASMAEQLGRRCHLPELHCQSLWVAGILHDMGRLALAQAAPWEYCELDELATVTERPLWEVERRVLGADHAQAGAFLAAVWGFPSELCEAIELHHEPRRARLDDEHSVVAAVYAASASVDLPVGDARNSEQGIDRCFLQDAGLDRAFDEVTNEPAQACAQ